MPTGAMQTSPPCVCNLALGVNGEAEIGDLDLARVGQQDVLGLWQYT